MKINATVEDVLSDDLEFLYMEGNRDRIGRFQLHPTRLSRIRKLHKRNKKNPERLPHYRLSS